MNQYDYAWEKLSLALVSMVRNSGSIRRRIMDAFIYHLHTLRQEHLPGVVRDEFFDIRSKVTQQGSFEDSINLMTDDEIGEIAERLVYLFAEFASEYKR